MAADWKRPDDLDQDLDVTRSRTARMIDAGEEILHRARAVGRRIDQRVRDALSRDGPSGDGWKGNGHAPGHPAGGWAQ